MDRKLVLLVTLLLVSGIVLTLTAYFFGVFSFDIEVALWLREFDHPIFIVVMEAVSFFGNGWIPAMLVAGVAAICALRKKWLEAVFVVATLSAVLLTGVLKELVGRPRPPTSAMNLYDMVPPINQYAYPSGHVLFFVVFFGFVAYLAWMQLTGWVRWLSISFCTILIVLIGPSRIFLGEHWVSDVVGSYIIGTFWLINLILLYQMVLHWRRKKLKDRPAKIPDEPECSKL